MKNLTKKFCFLKHFVIFITFFIFSCSKQSYSISKTKEKQILIATEKKQNTDTELIISKYREILNQKLSEVLTYCPENLEVKGKWQTTLGYLISDVTLKKSNELTKNQYNKEVDLCILNYGGIGSFIKKGEVTVNTAFKIIPFENILVIVELKGEQILEMINYIIKKQEPSSISGIVFTVDKEQKTKNILIQNKLLDLNKTYYVATNDYLSYGGADMNLFKKNIKKWEFDYKIRDILIDYFKSVKILPVINEIRIIEE